MKNIQWNSLIRLVLIVGISGLSVYAASGSSSGPPLIFLVGFYLFDTIGLIASGFFANFGNLGGLNVYVLREYLREDYFLFFLLGAMIFLGFNSIIRNPENKGRLFFVSCGFFLFPMTMAYSNVDWIPFLKGMGGPIPLAAEILKHFYSETNISFEIALGVSVSVIFLSILLYYSSWIGNMINEFKEKGGIKKDLVVIYQGTLIIICGIVLVSLLIFGILINTVWRTVEMMREPISTTPVNIVAVGIGATVLITGVIFLWWRIYGTVEDTEGFERVYAGQWRIQKALKEFTRTKK